MKRIVLIAALAALLVAVIALAGVGRPGAAHGSPAPAGRGITVTGTGTTVAVPDEASFSFGVESTGATARAAQAANAERMAGVVAALKGAGVAGRDLQTTDVSVMPDWSNDGSRVEGFRAHASVQAKVRRIARAGAVVDAAVAAGATETSGPSLERADRDAQYRTALRNAVADARAKAEALAAEADVQLGRVVRVEEGAPAPQPYYERAALTAVRETPIEPGTQETQATVTVTFSLA
ncbi:MAG TPA: SIMPL domain-containing protein [Gaiellaceae bacterium]|jgi:hypothetical protein